MGLAIFVVVGLALGFGYVAIMRAGGFSFPWIQFYIRGKESGFSFSEVNLLRKVAINNRLKNPTSLFWSVKTLDRCIRSAIIGFRSDGAEADPQTLAFLGKLFDFRKRVEFDQPKYRLGLSSTRSIPAGQVLKIVLPGGGVFVTRLIENNRRHLAIAYPQGGGLPQGFSWRRQDIKLYFWRKEDAGYFVETRVMGDFSERKVPILHVAHAEDLVRAQKRQSVRRDVGQAANLYPLRSIGLANETIELKQGFRCQLIDISEDGAAVAIGGKAKAGVPVKIQARLGDETVVICGTIKSANFKQRNNASILHLEAKEPSVGMRVKILTFVYGLFGQAAQPGVSDVSGAKRSRAKQSK